MAEKEKKKKEKKVVLERVYNVPLRKGWLKAPRYKRANKAVKTLREFLQKHMKSEEVKLGMHVNEQIWKHGIKNPPHHVKVTAEKDDDGIVRAELEGYDYKEAVKAKPKEEKATGLKGKLQSAMGKIKEEDKTGEKSPEVKPEAEQTEEKTEEKKVKRKEEVKKEEKPIPKKKAPAKKKADTEAKASEVKSKTKPPKKKTPAKNIEAKASEVRTKSKPSKK